MRQKTNSLYINLHSSRSYLYELVYAPMYVNMYIYIYVCIVKFMRCGVSVYIFGGSSNIYIHTNIYDELEYIYVCVSVYVILRVIVSCIFSEKHSEILAHV